MFGWFQPARKRSRPASAPRTCLHLEHLETRLCPAAPTIASFSATRIGDWLAIAGQINDESPSSVQIQLGNAVSASVTADSSGIFKHVVAWPGGTEVTAIATDVESLSSNQGTATIATPADANPLIVLDEVIYGVQRSITISGQVYDESPGGLMVELGGVAMGSTTTSSTGHFSLTLTAMCLGTVSVTTTDINFNSSSAATVTLENEAPTLVLNSVVYGAGRSITLSGHVADEFPNGLLVDIQGAVVGFTATDASGDFSVTLIADSVGLVSLTALDDYGNSSNTATVTLANAAPTLSLNPVEYGAGRSVTISGHVNDEFPNGLLVNISGAAMGMVTTDASGNFSVTLTADYLGLVSVNTTDDYWSSSNTATVTLENAAPTVTLNPVEYGAGRSITISGHVNDEYLEGVLVSIGGVASNTTTTDANGEFSVTVTADYLGEIQVIAMDDYWNSSSTVSVTLESDPPIVVLYDVVYGDQRTVTISGYVSDESPGGLLVDISGAALGSVTTDASGNFSVTLTADSLGLVYVATSDAYWNYSDTATLTLEATPPTIDGFACVEESGGWYEFCGYVFDDYDPAGLTISFGGEPVSLQGATTTVDLEGYFCLRLQLTGTQADEGLATAQVANWWGLSVTAEWLVHQTGV